MRQKEKDKKKSHARNSKFDLSLLNVLRFSVRPKLCDKRKTRIQSVPFCSIFQFDLSAKCTYLLIQYHNCSPEMGHDNYFEIDCISYLESMPKIVNAKTALRTTVYQSQ